MKQINQTSVRSATIAFAAALALFGAVASAHADKVKLSTVKIKGTIKSSNGDEPGTIKNIFRMNLAGTPPKGLSFYVDVEISTGQKFSRPAKLRLTAPIETVDDSLPQFRLLRKKQELQIVSGDKVVDRVRLPLLLNDAEVNYVVHTGEFDTKLNPLSGWSFEVFQFLTPPPSPVGADHKIKDPIVVKVPCDPKPIPVPYPVPHKP